MDNLLKFSGFFSYNLYLIQTWFKYKQYQLLWEKVVFNFQNFLKSIAQFFYNLWHFKTWLKFKKYERLLAKGVLDREKEKIKLLREARVLIPKKTKKGRSLYIPLKLATKIKIKAMILHEFGHKMKALGVKITDDLKFI